MEMIKKILAIFSSKIIKSYCTERECYNCAFNRKNYTCMLSQRKDKIYKKYYPQDWVFDVE